MDKLTYPKAKNVTEAKKNFISQMDSVISNVVYELRKTGVVIWGKGELAKRFTKLFCDRNSSECIHGYCDSFTKESNSFLGKPLLSPKDAAVKFPKSTFIIASMYYEDIIKFISEDEELKKIKDNCFISENFFNDYNLLYNWLMCFYNRDCNSKDYSIPTNFWAFFDYYFMLEEKGELQTIIRNTLSLLEDNDSICVLKNRLFFFLTGDISYLRKIPITSFSNEYFNTCFSLTTDESFFDCGAYDGDTIKAFIHFCNNGFTSITAFEPNLEFYNKARDFIYKRGLSSRVMLVNAGTGYKTKPLNQIAEENNDSENTDFKIIALDNYIDRRPSIIKMDIEGYELDTLKGAVKILSQYHPKLAICLYHLPQDLFEIPLFLSKFSYKIQIRQHLGMMYDTVLYAEYKSFSPN